MKLGNRNNNIFIKNESSAIAGFKSQNQFILAGIITLCLMGLGHSIGGLQDLAKRMDNPFTKWIPLGLNVAEFKNGEDLIAQWNNDPTLKKEYGLNDVKPYSIDFMAVYGKDAKMFDFKTRTIDYTSDLFNAILDPNNLVSKNQELFKNEIYKSNLDWVILKKETVDKIGLNNKTITHSRISYTINEEIQPTLLIPVLAVVKEIPDYCDLLESVQFNQLRNSKDQKPINPVSGNEVIIASSTKKNKGEIEKGFGEAIFDVDHSEIKVNGEVVILNKVFLKEQFTYEQIDSIGKSFVDKNKDCFVYNEYNTAGMEQLVLKDASYLSFSFNNMDKVRAFKSYLQKNYKLELSMNQVEDKENFSFIVKLTSLLGLFLFLVSILACIIFLFNIISSHLEKIKPNLGTFKAFGLSNDEMLKDYNYIFIIFILKAIGIAVLINFVYHFFAKLIGVKFNIFHWSIILSIIILIVVSNLLVKKVISKNLKKTPGDLIYGR